jgi:hypothetical protein
MSEIYIEFQSEIVDTERVEQIEDRIKEIISDQGYEASIHSKPTGNELTANPE